MIKPSDNKRSVIIEEAHVALFEAVTDEQAGQLLKAMLAHQAGKEYEVSDPLMAGVVEMLKKSVDDANEEYDRRSEANRRAAAARWNKDDDMQVDANACERMQVDANDADRIGLDRITASKMPSKEKRASAKFTPPTVDEVSEYVREKGYAVDPEAFVDFYASKGWKVGSQPMKDWRAAVRTWAKRDAKPKSPPGRAPDRPQRFDYERQGQDLDALQKQLVAKQRASALSGG